MTPSNIDGIRLAVLTARFNGIARKMANTLSAPAARAS